MPAEPRRERKKREGRAKKGGENFLVSTNQTALKGEKIMALEEGKREGRKDSIVTTKIWRLREGKGGVSHTERRKKGSALGDKWFE